MTPPQPLDALRITMSGGAKLKQFRGKDAALKAWLFASEREGDTWVTDAHGNKVLIRNHCDAHVLYQNAIGTAPVFHELIERLLAHEDR